MRRRALKLPLLLPCLLAACGLHTEPPMTQTLPATFAGLPAARPPVDLSNYWAAFDDPMLNQLVAQGLAQNFTIQAAQFRVDAASAFGTSANASLRPSLSAFGGIVYAKLSPVGQTPQGTLETTSQTDVSQLSSAGNLANPKVSTTTIPIQSNYPAQFVGSGTLALSWTLPLFGRLGATQRAVIGTLGLATATQQAAQVAVIAGIAQAYVGLRSDQQRLSLLQAELAETNHITNLVQIQAQAGIASDLDVARAQNHADQLSLKIPAAQLGIDTDITRIMILEGQTAPNPALLAAGPLPPAPSSLPDVVPADLLRLRPQIMQAEAVVATDAASLGFATADLYPQFTLGGSVSLIAGANLLDPLTAGQLPNKLTLLEGGPGVTIPLFDWGQRYATAKGAQANLAAGIEDYHEAVVEGIGDVNAALASIDASRGEVAAATREQQSALRALNSAQILFGRGLTDLSSLLDVETQRETADMDAADANAAVDTAAINLYAAVGGGAFPVSTRAASAGSGAVP